MRKRVSILLVSFSVFMTLAALLVPAASLAIGKSTPTPVATEAPIEDIDTALDDVLELLEEQEYEDAAALADRILEADAQTWRAQYYRGFAFVQLDELDDALDAFGRALELRPWDSGIWRLRGDNHLKNSDPRQAANDYERSLFYNPRAYQTYVSLVGLHERDVDKTIHNIYQAIVEAAHANSQGSSNRANEALSDAIDAFRKSAPPSELGYVYFQRANIWTGDGNWERALEDIDAALALQPGMQDYHLTRGSILAETADADSAAPDYHERMTLIERESIEETLDLGETVTIEMDYGVVARLRFAGEAGQIVTIAARDNLGAGVDPLLVLLDINGVPLAGDDDGGGELDSLISNYELPADGAYTAVVSHANSGYEGKVRVSLR